MNVLLLFQSLMAFAIGVLSLFLVYIIVRWYMNRIVKIKEENNAISLFNAGVILSCANLMAAVIGPGINVIRFINQDGVAYKTVLNSLSYISLFVLIGMLFSFLVIAGGIIILFQLTHVNEWEELKSNNIKTAIISSALILGLSLIMKEQVSVVCEMFIPYPQVMQIH
jgi:hypothetical protein